MASWSSFGRGGGWGRSSCLNISKSAIEHGGVEFWYNLESLGPRQEERFARHLCDSRIVGKIVRLNGA